MIECRAVHSDITPQEEIPLSGFGNRTGNFQCIHDPLEANLIILEQGNRRIAILSIDALYFGTTLQKRATDAAFYFFNIAPESLLLAASHTHFAPATDDKKPRLGAVDDAYLEKVGDTIEAMFKQASELPSSRVHMEMQNTPMHHAVNRRRSGWHIDPAALRLVKGSYMAPNFNDTIDDTARVLQFVNEAGIPQAVLWNYACHPTSFPSTNSVSADFPGTVRASLRKRFSPDLPVVFLQGFAGDKRPIEVGGKISLLGRIRRSIGGPHFGRFDIEAYTKWADSLAICILAAFDAIHGWSTIQPDFAIGRSALKISDIVEGHAGIGAPHPPMSVQYLRLGKEATIIALSAEPVSQYVNIILEAINVQRSSIIPVGYTDCVFGYLPTSAMIQEGGYEVSGFFPAFNLSGQFNINFETRVISAIKKLKALVGQTPSLDI